MQSKHSIRAALFVSLLALPFALGQNGVAGAALPQPDPSPPRTPSSRAPLQQSTGESRPLDKNRPKAPAITSVDRILGNVVPGKDGWVTELYDEEIKQKLSLLKDSWKKRPLDSSVLSGLLSADFQGARPRPPQERTTERAGNPFVSLYATESSPVLGRIQFLTETEEWLARFREVSSVELKTTGIVLERETPPQVLLPIRYNIVGRASDGSRQQATGYWTTRWRKIDGQWQWFEMARHTAWEARAKREMFTDISSCSLPKGESRDQFQRGVDWWTANLDAAAHLQIHGHNGISVADVDGDGHEDFYVCQGSGLPNRLFRSNGDGTFQDVSRITGLDILDSSSSSLFFDYDNDGDPDLLVIGLNFHLFRNDGKGKFELLNTEAIGLVPSGHPTAEASGTARRSANTQGVDANPRSEPLGGQASEFFSMCVADYNRDSWLDIYVTSYFRTVGNADEIVPTPYHDANNGARNHLFRNDGDGTFTNVTEEAGLDANNTRFSFACSWADYDKNGYPDVYVANDFGRNNLYRNNGDGTFTDVSAEAGVEDIAAGMSVSWEDYDNDGWLDLYVGNMYSTAGMRTTSQSIFLPASDSSVRSSYQRHARGNSLFRNLGNGTFADVSQTAGVTMGRWAWSSNFLDADLDGNEDIYITNGYITNEQTADL